MTAVPVQSYVQLDFNPVTPEGEPADPDAITLTLVKPDRSVVVLTDGNIKRLGVGQYYARICVTEFGQWIVRWQCAGGGATMSGGNQFLLGV